MMKLKMLMPVVLFCLVCMFTGCDEISFDVEGENYVIMTGPTPSNNFKPIAYYGPEEQKILIMGSDIPLNTIEKMIWIEIENVDPENRTRSYTSDEVKFSVQYSDAVGGLDGDVTIELVRVDDTGGLIQGGFSGVLDNGEEITNGVFSVTNMEQESYAASASLVE